MTVYGAPIRDDLLAYREPVQLSPFDGLDVLAWLTWAWGVTIAVLAAALAAVLVALGIARVRRGR